MMNSQEYWQLFLETGAPEAYLMYSRTLKAEVQHVYDNSGGGPAGYRI